MKLAARLAYGLAAFFITGTIDWRIVEEPFGPDEDDEEHLNAEYAKSLASAVAVPIEDKQSELSKALPGRRLKSFTDVYDNEEELKFLIDNVLPESGLVFLGGTSGTGKTILAIQMCANLVMARPTMTWKQSEDLPQLRAMMLSLEMSEVELQRRIQDMYPSLSDAERMLLGEHFVVYSEAEPMEFWNDSHCADFVKMIAASKANIILIDSASVSFGPTLNHQEEVNRSLKNLYAIRVRMNVAILIVAHTRKPPAGISSNPEDMSINDLFGHSGIAHWGSAIFLLMEDDKTRREAIKSNNGHEVDKTIHVVQVKSRFGSSNAAFKTKLPSLKKTKNGEPLQFRRDAIELPPLSTAEKKKLKNESKLSDSMQGVDFGAILGLEDDEL